VRELREESKSYTGFLIGCLAASVLILISSYVFKSSWIDVVVGVVGGMVGVVFIAWIIRIVSDRMNR